MQRFFATPDREAHFDFLSLIISLERYQERDLVEMQRAIAWEPHHQAMDERTSYFRSLIKHEVTHFLDMTTTAWGGQYTLRKLRLLRKLENDAQDFVDADQVFALETGELEMHTALVQAGSVPPVSCDTIQHELIYRDEFGVCIVIYYLKDGVRCHTVPITMLSLLEANATASEYLSLIQCAESCDDIVDRQLAIKNVHRRFEALLNDSERLEYSSLLHLTRVHFNQLGLAEQLNLVAAISRFALDASPLSLSIMAIHIERSFSNKELGDALSMELRRGACRQLIFFKTVLFIYGWLNHLKGDKQTEALALISAAPTEAILRMWTYLDDRDLIRDTNFREDFASQQEKWMGELGASLKDCQIFSESCRTNRTLLKATSAGTLSFHDLKLLNAVLGDETEVVFPNSIGICVPRYFNENLNVFVELDRTYREMKHKRFHIQPGMLNLVRRGEKQ